MCQPGTAPRAAILRGRLRRTIAFAQGPSERIGKDVVDEGPPTVDLDHRKQLAIPLLELGIAGDVDLAQLELELAAKLRERRPRPFAQVAAARGVEDDALEGVRRYG